MALKKIIKAMFGSQKNWGKMEGKVKKIKYIFKVNKLFLCATSNLFHIF